MVLKPICALDLIEMCKIGHKGDGCMGNRYGLVDPETRFYGWGTGWIAEIRRRHGWESLFVRASSVLQSTFRGMGVSGLIAASVPGKDNMI